MILCQEEQEKKSDNGTYHIMLRGINKQQIFEEKEDYEKFLEVLKSCKAISEFKLYAYCLMGNHIHLLIKEGKESLETIFKRIGGKFVYWYNVKYQRVGHLFGDEITSLATIMLDGAIFPERHINIATTIQKR